MAIWTSLFSTAQNNNALFELNFLSATPTANSNKTVLTYSAYDQTLELTGTFTQGASGAYQGTVTGIAAKDASGSTVYSITNFQTSLSGLVNATPAQRLNLFSGNDNITGSARGDWLYGHAGTDVIFGGKGNDFIDGGSGTDYLSLQGIPSDYQLQSFSGTLQAKHLQDGEVDVAVNTERVLFGNNSVLALDTQGVAGDVFRLYYTLYHRAMRSTDELKSFGADVLAVDRGKSLSAVADGVLQNSGLINLSDANYVDVLYQSVLHRDATSEESLFLTNQLAGGVSRADLLVAASHLDPLVNETAPLIVTGIWFLV